MVRIVIIGCSVVGMNMAYFLQEAGFRDIKIIEKRLKFTREQTVLVNYDIFFKFLPLEVIKNLRNKCFVESVVFHVNYKCNNNIFGQGIVVVLKVLEKTYYNFIQKQKNISVIHSKSVIFNKDNIEIDTKEKIYYDILIGADGASSSVRKDFFDNKVKKIFPYNKFFGGYFKFKIKPFSKSHKKKDFTEQQNFIRGFPTKKQDTYTINLILSKKQFEDTKEKGLLAISKELNNITNFFELKLKSEKPIDYSIFPINLFISNSFAKYNTKTKKYYFLVGDSAFPTHFMTGSGLNNGLMASVILAGILGCSKNPVKEYNEQMGILSKHNHFTINHSMIRYKKIIERCKSKKKTEMIEYLNIFIDKDFNSLSKEQICLYLSQLIDRNYYDKLTIEEARNIGFITETRHLDCFSKKIKKQYISYIQDLLNYEKKTFIKQDDFKVMFLRDTKNKTMKNLIEELKKRISKADLSEDDKFIKEIALNNFKKSKKIEDYSLIIFGL